MKKMINILDYVGYDGELIFPIEEDGSTRIPVEELTDKPKFKHGNRPLYLTMDLPESSEGTQFVMIAHHQGQLKHPRNRRESYEKTAPDIPYQLREMLIEWILIGLLLFWVGGMIFIFTLAFQPFI